MRWRVLTILLGCLLLFAGQAGASGPDPNRPIKQMRHTSWNEASGLSGTVYSLAQTTDGFLWIGTSTGLYRFDGLKFEPFLASEPDHSILDVRALLATSDGGLWIGYRNGLAFLKQDTAAFYTEQQGLPYGQVGSLAQTTDGAIWAAVAGGLARLANGRGERIQSNWNYPSKSPERVLVDGAGTLWVTGGESIHFLLRGSRTFQSTNVKVSTWTEICAGPDRSVWITDPVAHNLFNFPKAPETRYSSVTAVPLQDINNIYFDSAHALWLATGRGLYRIPGGSIPALPKQTNQETEKDQFMLADGLSGREARVVIEDREGNIWVGTTNGLDRFSDRSTTQINMGHTPAILIAGPHSEVWASPFGASPFLIPLHNSKPYRVSDWWTLSFYMDRASTLWTAMQSHSGWEKSRGLWKDQDGRLTMVPPPGETDHPEIKEIVGDAGGRLWMIVNGYGEYSLHDGKWNRASVFTGKDQNISPDAEFIDGLGHVWLVYYARNTVVRIDGAKTTLFTPGHGHDLGNPIVGGASGTQVWISGTRGLGIFDGERFQNISATDGSQFGNVTAVIPTEHDGLWLKAPEGVIQIPQEEVAAFLHDHTHAVRYRTFDVATDFAAPLARTNYATTGTDTVRSGDGKLWFADLGGVAMIDPAHLAKNELPPPVFIRSLTANSRVYSTYRDPILPKSTREVSLDYTALSLTLSERNRFRYQLAGFDTEWKDAGTRRQAFYTNLEPGTYTFKVIAANNDGVWNQTGASATFEIPPTFLQTIWFKLLLIVAAALSIWMFYALRLRHATGEIRARLGERLQERERIARELHDTLLQDFQAVILRFQIAANRMAKGDPNRATMEEGLSYADDVLAEGRNYISDIRADRKAFQELSESLGEFGNELSQLQPTTFALSVTGSRFKLDPIIQAEIYRIGREAIRNAFTHSHGSKVEAEIIYGQSDLVLRIRDDGDGIDPDLLSSGRPGHWGIRNMKERSEKIGAGLTISSQTKMGTLLELKLPVRLAQARRASLGSS